MASGDVFVELPPSTPTPSTSDISILAQQQQQDPQPIQGVQEAFKIPEVLYTAAFSILWLFGLARNLASYVVSLGIIPLKTATQLFGIKPTVQTRPHPILAERDRKPGSRYTRVDKSAALTNPRPRHGWNTHTSGKASSSSTDSTVMSTITRTTDSAPGTPRKHYSTSLPAEALTDSENILHRPRNPNRPAFSRTSRLANLRDASGSGFVGVSEEGEMVMGEGGGENAGKRARSRSRVDHSTRRILFVDPKNSRRQTAPPVPYHSQSQSQPPLVSGVEVEEKLEMTESPLLDTVGLPSIRSQDSQQPPQPWNARPKSTPQPEDSTSHPTTNEFGEFVSAPTLAPTPTLTPAPASTTHSSHTVSSFPGENDRDATASGTESTSERRSRGKERFRSGFKLFGKKRSSSVASTGEVTAPEPTSSTSKSALSKSGSNKLRRKSPYPCRLDSQHRSSTEAVHKQHLTAPAVSVSDAEAPSTTWLRSRPKKLTRKARSNSLSEGAREPLPTSPTSQSSTDAPAQMAPASTSPLPTPPLIRSSTMASTSTSASASSTNPNPATNSASKRNSGLSFNPLRDLEARLYYRHGVGTGPSTADVSSYMTTPVPKTGIKRTNPYVLLGVEPPRGSPNASSVHLTSSRHGSTSSPRPTSSNLGGPPAPPRRVSAPAGGGGDENVVPLKRPHTPSRAHTQPL